MTIDEALDRMNDLTPAPTAGTSSFSETESLLMRLLRAGFWRGTDQDWVGVIWRHGHCLATDLKHRMRAVALHDPFVPDNANDDGWAEDLDLEPPY